MNAPGRRVRCVRALHGFGIIAVDQQKINGANMRKVPPARVHQKSRTVPGQGQGKVIGNALVPVIVDSQPEGSSKINARLPFIAAAVAGKRGNTGHDRHLLANQHSPVNHRFSCEAIFPVLSSRRVLAANGNL